MSALNKIFSKRKRKVKENVIPPSGSATTNNADESQVNKTHDKILMYLDPVIEMVNITKEASELLPPLKLACGVTIRILTIVRGMVKNDADWEILVKRLDPYSSYLSRQYRKIEETQQVVGPYITDPDFKEALDSFLRTLNKIQAKAADDSERFDKKKAKTYFTQALKVKAQTDTIQGLGVELDRDYERLKGEIISCIHTLTLRIQTQTSQIQLFQRLNSINARGERILPLTAGTRTVLLERLRVWAGSISPEEQIFWLCDEAGTGKSTVAGEMVRRWKSEGCLAARFFFDGQEQLTRTLDRFCVTVAKEIIENHPRSEYILSSIIEKHRDLDNLDFESKFKVLISDLLEQIAEHRNKDGNPSLPLVLVIDSLDECILEDRARLMKSLTESSPSFQAMKVFLTSRSLPDIERVLGASSMVGGRDQLLLDVKSEDRDKDIGIYVKATLAERFSPQIQKAVVDCSNGLFLSASLACSALLKKSPSKASHAKLLTRLENMTPNDTFRDLYQTVLEVALVDDDEVDIIIAVLKGVALPFQPVSIYTIATFFPLEEEEDTISCIDFYVQRLGSIMKDGTPYLPVHLVHPTFRVYLESLHPENTFYFPFQPGHEQIAFVCLEILSSTLAYDICGLEKPNEPLPTSNILALPDVLPTMLTSDTTAPLRYAISFWTHHASLTLDSVEIIARMKHFFQNSFLHWLEWASILGVISDILHGLTKVWNEMKAPLSAGVVHVDDNISDWCLDALRFVQRHQGVISQSGMQAYTSALAFSPTSSAIYRHYSRKPPHSIPTVQGDAHPSSPTHRILDSGYRLSFAMCTFLTGGKQLVCIGARGGELQVWDIASGKCRLQIPGHEGRWNAGAQSKDGSLLVSGSSNGTICLWDIYGGSLLAGPCQADPKSVSALTFVSEDKVIASGGSDGIIKLWTTSALSKKKQPYLTLTGHTKGISILAVSAFEERIASGSWDHTIRLWDMKPSSPTSLVLRKHSHYIAGLVFSGDGKKLASTSTDGSVRLWDAATGVELAALIENGTFLDTLILAPDKDTLFASLNKGEIHRWRMSTGERVGPVLKEHTESVSSMKLTPNGRYLATGSHDHSIRVWDLFKDPPLSIPLRGHTDNVFEVAINPEGTQVVSTSLDDTLRIWDVAGWQGSTGYEDPKFGSVLSLLFSPRGTILAANMIGGVIQVWDVRRGSRLEGPFVGHTDDCEALAFSPDETTLATGSKDRSVRLWNCIEAKGRILQCHFTGHTSSVTCVTFVGSASRIASCSQDGDLRVWDSESQTLIGLYDIGKPLSIIVFSEDASRLAAYSTDHTITLWDTGAYNMIGHPISHDPGLSSQPVQYLEFSPDQTKLVSFDPDKLKLFHISSGLEEVGTLLMLGEQASPAFSSDNPGSIYLGRRCLDISHIPEEGLGIMHNTDLLHSTDLAHSGRWPCGIPRLYCTERSREIYSYSSKAPLLIWPPDLPVHAWAVYEDIVALGTKDGRVLILKFPEDTAGMEIYHSASSGASAESAS